jgi:RNA polymerase sigma factor (sigma-70 family)
LDTKQYDITQLTDHLFRQQSGKMVSVLVRLFGTQHLQLAEDVVQDTLLKAMEIWSLKGIPDNPAAWLYRVAKNKAVDIIRRNRFSVQYDFSDAEGALLRSEYTLSSVMDRIWREDLVQDDLLRMMFACCHPEITEENQVTLILKTLCGLSTAEIARSFLCPEDTVSKRLYRTKEFFREKKIRPEFPAPQDIGPRTNAVLRSVYLIFNEGYNSASPASHIRKDLLDQAIYLTMQLAANALTALPEVYAALGLMHFHAARVESRIGEDGSVILLAEQDRTTWDREMIARGNRYMNKAATGETLSSYHIEAAIAFEHCVAASLEETNWKHILYYYDLLNKIAASSVTQLNRIAVIYKLHGPQKALEEIETSPERKAWERICLFHSLLGEIYASDNIELARKSYEKAISLSQIDGEKELLLRKLAALV